MIVDIFKEINWVSVIVATIGYFGLGAIWYSFLFKNKWIVYNNINMDDPDGKKGVGAIMLASFVVMFITSAGIAFLAYRIGMWGFASGIKLGLFTGIFFLLYLYGNKYAV